MGKTIKLTVSVPRDEFKKAIRYAKREGISKPSHLIREAIEAWLEPRQSVQTVREAKALYDAVRPESSSLGKAGARIASRHWPKD
ncbi:MAG: hypothetical protein HY401_00365 [Elusimicrobia bacterium]|nr:hypothetical protein [Elusimicrobiota bacterium]